MKIAYTLRAHSELAAIYDYIVEHNPSAATKVIKAIRSAIDMLQQVPYIRVKTNVTGVRMLPVSSSRYLVYYAVYEDMNRLDVVSVRHSAQQRIF